MENFKLTIRTPEKEIYAQKVESMHFDSEGGEMEVFGNHASVTASIIFSPVIVKENSKNQDRYMARNGIFAFNNETNEATLLALHCEKDSEVNKKTAAEYLEFVKKQLAEGKDLSQFQILYLQGEKIAIEEQIEHL